MVMKYVILVDFFQIPSSFIDSHNTLLVSKNSEVMVVRTSGFWLYHIVTHIVKLFQYLISESTAIWSLLNYYCFTSTIISAIFLVTLNLQHLNYTILQAHFLQLFWTLKA